MTKKDTTVAPFDLAALDTKSAAENAYEFELTHPVTGALLGVFLSVVGDDSHAVRELSMKSLHKMQRNKAQADKRGKPFEFTLDEIESANADSATARTTAWRNVVLNGEPLTYSEDNARMLFTQYPWIGEQVISESKELGNFVKG